jgi:hypothetical protein
MSQGMQAALMRPSVDQAMDRFVDEVFSDPALASEGEALFEAAVSHPELSAAGDAFQDKLGELPEMQALIAQLMQRHPDASPDRIGQLAGEHIATVMDGPELDRAFDRAIERLFERPKVRAAFDRLEQAWANNARLLENLGSVLEKALEDPRVQRHLAERNGGQSPDRARAMELFGKHALSAERLEQLQLGWLALPATRELARGLMTELARAPSFRDRVGRLFAALQANPAIQAEQLQAFGALLEQPPNAARAMAAADRMVDSSHVEQVVADFLSAVIADPALQAIANRAIDRFTSEPAFVAYFERFATEW